MDNERESLYTNADNAAEQKKAYRTGLITGLVWGIGILLAVILFANIVASALNGNGGNQEIEKALNLDDDSKASIIQQYIDKYFMEDVDEDVLIEGMYTGMLKSLDDPYSVYYTKEQYEEMNESSSGQYTGIGVVVNQNVNTKEIVVSKIYSDSQATEAGLKVGDIIKSVDGEDVSSKSTDDLVTYVRGKEGTDVTLGVEREGEPLEITITRKVVEVDMVTYEMLEDNIGYISIDQFSGLAADQVRAAVEDLLEQGMEKVIVDVRDNPGGDLECVRDIVNIFIPKEKLVLYSQTKDGRQTKYYTQKEVMLEDMPLCVLVNGNSASASEVFAGDMKCYNRGILVGTTTFGKGIMQSVFNLGDGTGLKLTIGKYYLPDDSNIHKIGIEPDYEVQVPEDIKNIWAVEHSEDPQLCKAVEVLKEQ